MHDLVPGVEDTHLFNIEREVLQLLELSEKRGDGDGGAGDEEGGTSQIRNGGDRKTVWSGAGLCRCGSCQLFNDSGSRTVGSNNAT